jgi:hypothetical protein
VLSGDLAAFNLPSLLPSHYLLIWYSLLKRGIIGTWHKISAKHLQAYLDEMCFRFDNRKNPYLFRDTLLRMLEAEHVEYKQLIAEVAA